MKSTQSSVFVIYSTDQKQFASLVLGLTHKLGLDDGLGELAGAGSGAELEGGPGLLQEEPGAEAGGRK